MVLEARLVLLDGARLLVHAALVAPHLLLDGGQLGGAPGGHSDICYSGGSGRGASVGGGDGVGKDMCVRIGAK